MYCVIMSMTSIFYNCTLLAYIKGMPPGHFIIFIYYFIYSTILPSISSCTTFLSLVMWGATVPVERFSPGHCLNFMLQTIGQR